ncbi:hypothetical protein E4U55_000617 [Claviceps digitariae]|nr:hypothetical protein E4U55_000617 [Claviceps digitariae]
MVRKQPPPKNKTNPSAKKPSKRQHPSSSSQQTPTTQTTHRSLAHHDAVQSPKEQQLLLNIFSDAFAAVLSSDRFPILLQEIKQALYERDFGTAFGKEEYLEAYAARWSPTRALCYTSIFLGMQQYVDGVIGLGRGDELGGSTIEGESMSSGRQQQQQQQQLETDGQDQHQDQNQDAEQDEAPACSTTSQAKRLRMLCIGGCAAEHVAFASYLQTTNRLGNLTLLDSAPWANVTSLLQSALTTAPPLSKYASASARASNKALLEAHQLCSAFTQANVLDLTQDQLAEVLDPQQPQIVTLLFTLNELYTEAGISKTTHFLRALGAVLPAESLLLVVDSPGSYSEAAVGKDSKKYPMQWLLHHTLLQSDTSSAHAWERLESHDSVWFRLPEGLMYPIPLESMRYQMHLYRVHKNSTD